MIKTLRITSIVAAVLAAIFFVFSVVFGAHSDKHIEELLNSPGVIEKFNKAVGNKATGGGDQTSPLVEQAGAFALYLDPPKPKTPRPATGRTTGIARGPAATPKFKVLGTSFYKERPELSMALIDEPGKGLHWVRQSGKVGHFLIEQVKDGLVVFKDSKGTFEQKAEQKPEISLLEGAPGASDRAGDSSKTGASGRAGVSGRTTVSRQARGEAGSKSTLPALGKAGTGVAGAKSKAPQPRRVAEETEFQELVEKLRQIQRDFKSDKTGSRPSAKEKAALMDKVISEFKTSRLSAEEARRLSNLGKELEEDEEEPDSKKTKSVK